MIARMIYLGIALVIIAGQFVFQCGCVRVPDWEIAVRNAASYAIHTDGEVLGCAYAAGKEQIRCDVRPIGGYYSFTIWCDEMGCTR